MKQFTDQQHQVLVTEAKKQSRKLIDINDKGYNAYRLCLHFITTHYSKNSELQKCLKPRPEWEGLKLEGVVTKNTHWWERLIFLAPKDINITLDNILEYCDFLNSYNADIPFVLGEEPIRRDWHLRWTEYNLLTSPILEKVESGKLPENIYNYILAHQNLSVKNKILLPVNCFLEGKDYEWEQKAIDKALELFGQDFKEVNARTAKYTKYHELDLIPLEEYQERFNQILA